MISGPQQKRKSVRKDPVERLTSRVSQFKKKYRGCESDLHRTLAKVELDKFILLKERLECVWNEEMYDRLGALNIKGDLHKKKAERMALYQLQVKAYEDLLQ